MSYNPRHFVNREPQLAAFEACLQGREKSHVLLFHGSDGIGKTTMLYRLRELCRESKTTCALVDFQHDGLYKAEAIIHCLREQIRGDFFDAIGREIEACQRAFPEPPLKERVLAGLAGGSTPSAGQPAPIIHIDGQIRDIEPGAIAVVGHDVRIFHISNSHINFRPEEASLRIQGEKTLRLNKAFQEALERLVARELVVLLFDACEYATADAMQWLQEKLLDPLLAGDIPSPANLAIVLAGDPRCERGIWRDKTVGWGEGVAAHELDDLPPDAVKKYWIEIRGLEEATLPPVFRTRGAPPSLMVQMANLSAEV